MGYLLGQKEGGRGGPSHFLQLLCFFAIQYGRGFNMVITQTKTLTRNKNACNAGYVVIRA